MNSIDSKVIGLRQLFSLGEIRRTLITRDDLAGHLREDFEEDREEILTTQQLYATLGMIDKDADLYELLLGLYTEIVLGFYDAEVETLYVVTDTPEFGPQDALTYSHELVHGLQQQHFDIHSIFESLDDNSDRKRAFRALVEGDASISERLYFINHLDEEEQAEAQRALGSLSIETLRAAPHVIQRTNAFPYLEGFNFVLALLQADGGWRMINQAFENLPESTEQILHPEKFFARESPVAVTLPDIADILGEQWTQIREDTVGEFLLLAYLETGVPRQQAAAAAEGWGGDRFTLYKGPDGQNLLVSRIAWDDESHAQEFFDAFRDFMAANNEVEWNAVVEGEESEQIIEVEGQSIYLGIDTMETLMIFAPDTKTLQTVREVLKDM